MTVNTTESGPFNYAGNGVSTSFPFNGKIQNENQVGVTLTDALGNVSVQVLNTDYTVQNISESGADVVMTVAPPDQNTLSLFYDIDATQLTDYIEGGKFPAQSHEDALDKLTLLVKQIEGANKSNISMPPSFVGDAPDFPLPEGNNVIGWDQAGETLVNIPPEQIADIEFGSNNFIVDKFVDGVDYTAGVSTQITLSGNPGSENNTQITFDGLMQHKSTYSISGAVVTFDAAIPNGVATIECMRAAVLGIGVPADGTVGWEKFDSANQIGIARIYSTVAAMQADTTLSVGENARTLGYYAAGDGGGSVYQIAPASSPDGFGDHLLNNGSAAEILAIGDTISAAQYGATSSSDASDRLTAMFASGKARIYTGGKVELFVDKRVPVDVNSTVVSAFKLKAGDSYMTQDDINAILYVGGDDVIVRDSLFDCNSVAGGAQDFVPDGVSPGVVAAASGGNGAVFGNNCNRLFVDRCYFTRSWRLNASAVWLPGVDACKNAKISGCNFFWNYGGAVFTQSEGMSVTDCQIFKCNDAGIAFNTGGGKNAVISGCHVINAELGGVAIESGANNIAVTGCYFESDLTAAGNCCILTTYFSYAGASAVCSDLTVSGCVFNLKHTGGSGLCVGVRLDAIKNATFTGCNFRGTAGAQNRAFYTVAATGDLENVLIEGCSFDMANPIEVFNNRSTTIINNFAVHGNNFSGAKVFNSVAIDASATGSGFDVRDNHGPNTDAEPIALAGGGATLNWNIVGNNFPLIDNFGGTSIYAVVNAFGFRYGDETGVYRQASAPTNGTWIRGDTVWNTSAAVGAAMGWKCTVAGSPGTWVAMPNL